MKLHKPFLSGGATTNGGIDAGGIGTGFFKDDGTIDGSTYLKSLTITENNTANSDYQVVWSAGNTLYKTSGGLKFNPATGKLSAYSFYKINSSDDYFLLGGGGHILKSDYSLDSHSHIDLISNSTDAYIATSKVTNMITLSQSEYDAITTPNNNTMYVII